jgi:DNA-binding MarR family transcriptional regulator
MDEPVGTIVVQVARLVRLSFDKRARQIGVTRPQWQVLSVLARNEGINQGALADLLEVEAVTAGRMIDRMQEAQLVERRPDPADRRAWRLYPTERGAELLDTLRPLAIETYEIALNGIDENERQHLQALLEKMRANLLRQPSAEA